MKCFWSSNMRCSKAKTYKCLHYIDFVCLSIYWPINLYALVVSAQMNAYLQSDTQKRKKKKRDKKERNTHWEESYFFHANKTFYVGTTSIELLFCVLPSSKQ